MRKVLIALFAAALLVGGGVAYTFVTSPATASAQDEATEDPGTDQSADEGTDEIADDDTATERQKLVRPGHGEVLDEVLDSLVASDVITREQADEIVGALEERVSELRAEFQELRENATHFGRGFRFGFGLGEALEDGVIDADELAELGEDHPLNDPEGPAAEYLDDGELTQEELDELAGQFRGRFGRGSGDSFGNGDTEDTEG